MRGEPIVSPSCLYRVMKGKVGAVGERVRGLSEEVRNARNRNEVGIYFRKILLLLDNYFKSPAVLKMYPGTDRLEKIFPSFSGELCKIFSESVLILNHPNGVRTKDVEEFAFIKKNRSFILAELPEEVAKEKVEVEVKG